MKTITPTMAAANDAVETELRRLCECIPHVTGALVASGDGLLITHVLPPSIEPTGMAALAASQLALSFRIVTTAYGGGFHEVVVHGSGGYVAIYAADGTALTVLTTPGVNVGRLHLEARPAARAIADLLAAAVKSPRA